MILKGSVLNHKIKGTKNQSVWHFHRHQQTKCSNAAKAITAHPPPQKKPTKCYLHLLLPETSSTLLQPPPERPPHQHTLACWSSLKKEEKKNWFEYLTSFNISTGYRLYIDSRELCNNKTEALLTASP